MICHNCNLAELTSQVVENYHYLECGLPNVTLKNILIRTCPNCGMHFASIPNISGLHRVIAMALVKKDSRLTPAEIVFLRKAMGWSGADFARKMHSTPSQVSRWENGRIQMNVSNELLLRSLVAIGQKIENYDVEEAAHLADFIPARLTLDLEDRKWKKAA
ncbi:MAG: helix-turn-helix domain-containing protein [Geobacteraceae bacterium]|nr:helix-turn-helix domain-containing protein [Geobacteraceae bacterium]